MRGRHAEVADTYRCLREAQKMRGGAPRPSHDWLVLAACLAAAALILSFDLTGPEGLQVVFLYLPLGVLASNVDRWWLVPLAASAFLLAGALGGEPKGLVGAFNLAIEGASVWGVTLWARVSAPGVRSSTPLHPWR